MPTLQSSAAVQGFGLFTSKPASLFILAAEPGHGITFRRADVPVSIRAEIGHLAPQPPGIPARNTALAAPNHNPPVTVLTTEHVLSALVGLGITDAIIELDGAEVPILDGSAKPFVDAILKAGIEFGGEISERLLDRHGSRIGTQSDPSGTPITLTREITIESGPARITARPRAVPGARYTYELDYGPGAPIPPQRASWTVDPVQDSGPRDSGLSSSALRYVQDVAPARTFCLEAEAQQMRAMGLFKNLSPRDMLVIGPRGPIDNAYRFDNEPARHKLLDLIGDLALVGRPFQADITATRAGHAMNHAMARALLAAVG